MMRNLGIVFLMLLGCVLGANAQISIAVDVDQDSLFFGDVVTFTYKINLPAGAIVESIDFSPYKEIENLAFQMDTVNMEEIIDFDILGSTGYPITNDELEVTIPSGQEVITQGTVTGRILSLGGFTAPEPKIITKQVYQTLPLERALIMVRSKGVTDTINENKDIIREETSWTDYLPFLLGLLGVLGVIIGGITFARRMSSKRDFEDSAKKIVLKPAHLVAKEQLAKLEQQQLWQNDQEKEYHTQLTKIVRQYIERRYEIPAMEMTTNQLSRAMADKSVDQSISSRFSEILQIADKVKFAKGVTGPQINEQFMTDARQLIDDTQLIISEDEADI